MDYKKRLEISIHALRGEGDKQASRAGEMIKYFNPRPPWGGRLASVAYHFPPISISIHALRGEGDDRRINRGVDFITISIHALRGEGDFHLA